jgi:tetratricopeptide (TPR) repeat protein
MNKTDFKNHYQIESLLKTILRFVVFTIFFTLTFITNDVIAGDAKQLIDKGWNALIKDNDAEALKYFSLANEKATAEKDTLNIATSFLNLGICSYSVSYTQGLTYCMKAMGEFKKLEKSFPKEALEGRSRCLQLISTIYSRQGKYKEAIVLSKEAMAGFPAKNDTSGYLGLIYSSLGVAYGNLNMTDSSAFYHRLALQENLITKNFVYQPGSYINVADIELKNGNKEQSRIYYERALSIADSTGNRQAQVTSLLGMGKWLLFFDKKTPEAEECFNQALKIGSSLRDKSFYLKALEQYAALKKQLGDYKKALAFEEEMQTIKDTLYTWEKQKMVKSLEIQFAVSEKDRQLKLVQKEKDITQLTNYLLWVTIGFLIIISAGIILFLKRINKRDKLLIHTKESLVTAIEEQKRLKEQQLQNEIEYKESQLSAMTFQMLQKNELMQELKNKLDEDSTISKDNSISKIINKGLNHDKEWTDFDASFESINKNFYSRLKLAYPDISPNDLKICALIKMNLSIKEMAGILNISPDSVKTARYRLRKKLQLNTEDNLTDFILNLQ